MAKFGTEMTKDRLGEVVAAVRRLPDQDVLVGYPAETRDREDGEMTNPVLAYLHENGVPEKNIPARPSLMPGVRESKDAWTPYLRQAARAALDGNLERTERAMNAAGMRAAIGVQRKIWSGPFAPLSPRTIAARRIRSSGSSYRRKAVAAGDVTPLIDTAQMLRAVTYVVRDGKG